MMNEVNNLNTEALPQEELIPETTPAEETVEGETPAAEIASKISEEAAETTEAATEETAEVTEEADGGMLPEEETPAEDQPQEDTPEPAVEPDNDPKKNLWDDPDFPKTGWTCAGVEDFGEEGFLCELCGKQKARYIHHMEHPTYGKLSVGCVCAGKMEGDIPGAKRREREFKRKQAIEQDLPVVEPYHETYYLRYGTGKRITPQDLQGTKAFLQTLGFDGGELCQARTGKDKAENFRSADKNKGNQMYCSYCGNEISGVDFYRLPDGRLRCTTCSRTVVRSKAEVEDVYRRVLTNLENFFGAAIDVPVSIEVMDERKLKKRMGIPLGTRDSQSVLILGVAISKKKKYSIILENGAPRISLIATFAHELTHIWQYTHWDNRKNFKKCPKSKRLLIYEGMAKWVELQYLYLIGETNAAKREEAKTRNRQDEYGIGFCLYEDRYPLSREAMSCEETPFTLDRYPLD